MLLLEELTLQLGNNRYSYSFEARRSECVAILGESGAGKSTLLNLIGGFQEPDSGLMSWEGKDLAGLDPSNRPVTTLFQGNNLFAHLTVEDNLGLGLHPGLRLDKQDRKRIADALDRTGLTGMGKRKPARLSGGQLQRAALARCLLRDKPVLLLDEPFSALDEATRKQMQALTHSVIKENGLCSLVVTHNPDDAQALEARTLVMENGKLREA